VAAQCLVISAREVDRRIGDEVARINGFGRKDLTDPDEIKNFLIDHPQTIIFWDGDERLSAESISQLLEENVPASRVFLITDRALQTYPWLFKTIAFSNHCLRRFGAPAPALYARLALASLTPTPFGLSRYFSPGTPTQKITLKRSRQKLAAVKVIQKHLETMKVNHRLAALAAQASDELLMNGIFDAPVQPDGTHYRRVLTRDADFELTAKEHIDLELASGDGIVGIGVADQFGSLKRDVLMSFLSKDYWLFVESSG